MTRTAFAVLTMFTLMAMTPGAARRSTSIEESAQRATSIEESIDVGTVDETGFTAPFAINNHGTIAGAAHAADGSSQAFIWTEKDGFELIVDEAIAWDISDGGVVVGERHTGDASGFIWTRSGGVTDLQGFVPYAINNAGVLAGVCVPEQHPCVWRDGEITTLTELEGWVWDINAHGDVVGSTLDDRGFLWTRDGELIDFGPGIVESINNAGVMAGARRDDAGFLVPTVWTRQGVLALDPSGAARRVNNGGAVLVESGNTAPFVWYPRPDATVSLLSSRGPGMPFDMNDRGDVVGIVAIGEGSRVVIWQVRGGS